MTKRTAAKYKIDRRMGENIWGRAKSPVNRREYGPGQHGQRRKNKLSDFGTQLRAKQKLKGYYGDLTEKQFKRIYGEAQRVTGDLARPQMFSPIRRSSLYLADVRLVTADLLQFVCSFGWSKNRFPLFGPQSVVKGVVLWSGNLTGIPLRGPPTPTKSPGIASGTVRRLIQGDRGESTPPNVDG